MDFPEKEAPTEALDPLTHIGVKSFLIFVGVILLTVGISPFFIDFGEGMLLRAIIGLVFVPWGIVLAVAGWHLQPYGGDNAEDTLPSAPVIGT